MLERSHLRFIAMAIVALLLASPAAISFSNTHVRSSAQTETGSTGIVIPLYSYPDSDWNSVIQAKYDYPNVPFIVIISPDSGPGSYQDPNYLQGIQEMQAAGITVLGYVNTAYASYSLSSVEYQVYEYSSWYGVNGIMFDCMSNDAGDASYYWSLNTYAESLGMTFTMGNPGATVPSADIGVFNLLNVYENSGYPDLSSLYYSGYPTSDFSLTAYDVPFSSSYVASAASEVGYIYLTDGVWPDPYSGLPSYFTSLVATLSSLEPSGSPAYNSGGTATITVQSVSGGSSFAGMWTVVQSGGYTVASGFTPFSFTGNIGDEYTVSVANYGNYVFSNWQDGTTSPYETISLSQDTSLTAYYGGGSSTITIESSSLDGEGFSGMWTVVQSGGVTVASGFTPLTVAVSPGAQYTVYVANYGNYVFSNWQDGTTSPYETSSAQGQVLTAYYYT